MAAPVSAGATPGRGSDQILSYQTVMYDLELGVLQKAVLTLSLCDCDNGSPKHENATTAARSLIRGGGDSTSLLEPNSASPGDMCGSTTSRHPFVGSRFLAGGVAGVWGSYTREWISASEVDF